MPTPTRTTTTTTTTTFRVLPEGLARKRIIVEFFVPTTGSGRAPVLMMIDTGFTNNVLTSELARHLEGVGVLRETNNVSQVAGAQVVSFRQYTWLCDGIAMDAIIDESGDVVPQTVDQLGGILGVAFLKNYYTRMVMAGSGSQSQSHVTCKLIPSSSSSSSNPVSSLLSRFIAAPVVPLVAVSSPTAATAATAATAMSISTTSYDWSYHMFLFQRFPVVLFLQTRPRDDYYMAISQRPSQTVECFRGHMTLAFDSGSQMTVLAQDFVHRHGIDRFGAPREAITVGGSLVRGFYVEVKFPSLNAATTTTTAFACVDGAKPGSPLNNGRFSAFIGMDAILDNDDGDDDDRAAPSNTRIDIAFYPTPLLTISFMRRWRRRTPSTQPRRW